MSERVRFFEEASDDIEWYRSRSEIAEASFLRELDHAIEIVTEAPYRRARMRGAKLSRNTFELR